eukprot:17752-Heterococcus_DN1.PRE.2
MGAVRAVVDDIQLLKSPSSPHRASSVNSLSNQASPVPSLHSAITHKAVGCVAVTAFAVTPAVGSPLRAAPIRCDSSPDINDDDDASLDIDSNSHSTSDSTASSSRIVALQSEPKVITTDAGVPKTAQQHGVLDQESKLTECSPLNVKSMAFKQQHGKSSQASTVHDEQEDIAADDVRSLSKSSVSSSSVSSLSCDERHLGNHSSKYNEDDDVSSCPLTPPPLLLADDALHHSSSEKRCKSKSKSPKKHSASSKLKKDKVHSRLSLSGSSGGVRASSSNNHVIKSRLERQVASPRMLSPNKQRKARSDFAAFRQEQRRINSGHGGSADSNSIIASPMVSSIISQSTHLSKRKTQVVVTSSSKRKQPSAAVAAGLPQQPPSKQALKHAYIELKFNDCVCLPYTKDSIAF